MSTVQTTAEGSRRDRVFYTTMGVAAALVVFTGFSATFYQRGSAMPGLAPLFIVHGTAFTAWFVLYIAQSLLIAAGRRDLHRKLGTATVVLAALMVVLGTLAAIDSLRRGAAPIPGLDPRRFFAVPMFDMLTFPILVGAAYHFRRDPDTHKRLMVLATVSILSAALARFPVQWIKSGGPPAFFGLEDLLVLAGPVYDYITRGRVHRAYKWGVALVILSQPLRLAISGTPLWLGFANLLL